MPRKTDHQLGLEAILNNPATSFLKNNKTFGEIHSQSQMTIQQMVKHVGGQMKKRKTPKEPTDAEKSEARLNTMESKQNAS